MIPAQSCEVSVECVVCYYSVTDERLLLSCCSHVAEWLVTAEDNDSTTVNVPDGMVQNRTPGIRAKIGT